MGNSVQKSQDEEDLCLASSRGDIEKVRRLLESGVNVRCPTTRNDPLKLAIENGRLFVVKVLCSCGADVNRKYELKLKGKAKIEDTPLSMAMKRNDEELVRYLCLRGADVNSRIGWYSDEKESERYVPAYSYKILAPLFSFGMQVQVEDLQRHINSVECMSLLLNYAPNSIIKQMDMFACGDFVKRDLEEVLANKNRKLLSRPKAKNFPLALTRGYLSMRTHLVKDFVPFFFVLTIEYVLLCFTSPDDVIPKVAIFVEDFVNVREGTLAEGCATEDYIFVLQSMRKEVPNHYFACWSQELRQIWLGFLSQHFIGGLNFTGGKNDFFNMPTQVVQSSGEELVMKRDSINYSQEADVCKICFENQVDTVILPCGHCCCCYFCLEGMKDCPICRRPIDKLVKIFKS